MKSLAEHDLRDRIVKQAFGCREALEAYAFVMLRDLSAAEDVVQECLIVVMEKYDEFEEGTSMMAWTRAIVRWKALQLINRRKKQASLQERMLGDSVEAAFCEVDSDDHAEAVHERHRRLERCLNRVSDHARMLLDSVYGGGMSYQAAADSLGMKVEAVRKRIFRTKGQLRDCLQRSTGATQ